MFKGFLRGSDIEALREGGSYSFGLFCFRVQDLVPWREPDAFGCRWLMA